MSSKFHTHNKEIDKRRFTIPLIGSKLELQNPSAEIATSTSAASAFFGAGAGGVVLMRVSESGQETHVNSVAGGAVGESAHVTGGGLWSSMSRISAFDKLLQVFNKSSWELSTTRLMNSSISPIRALHSSEPSRVRMNKRQHISSEGTRW